ERDLESIGIGWLAGSVQGTSELPLPPGGGSQVVFSSIRIFGLAGRLPGSPWPADAIPRALRRFLDAVAERYSTPKQDLRANVSDLLQSRGLVTTDWLLGIHAIDSPFTVALAP